MVSRVTKVQSFISDTHIFPQESPTIVDQSSIRRIYAHQQNVRSISIGKRIQTRLSRTVSFTIHMLIPDSDSKYISKLLERQNNNCPDVFRQRYKVLSACLSENYRPQIGGR